MSVEGKNAPQYSPSSSGLTYAPAEQTDYQPLTLDIDRDSKNSAQNNQSTLLRAQWDDYTKRFAPVEDELIGQIGNAGYYKSQVAEATNGINAAFQTQAGVQSRNLQRYGVQTSKAQAKDQMINAGLAASTATAQAANQTRQGLKERDINVMAGGLVPSNQVKQGQG